MALKLICPELLCKLKAELEKEMADDYGIYIYKLFRN